MTLENVEGEVRWMLDHAGVDDGEPPRLVSLARRVLGSNAALQTVRHWKLPGLAKLCRVNGAPVVFVRSGLSPEQLSWAIAHELGHLAFGPSTGDPEDEARADAFAAALIAPRRAYTIALRKIGDAPNFRKLARWFVTTESCVALRYGEVTDIPLALVAPRGTRIRGAEFVWPDEPAKLRLPGVRKAVLTDDRRRVALTATCVG